MSAVLEYIPVALKSVRGLLISVVAQIDPTAIHETEEGKTQVEWDENWISKLLRNTVVYTGTFKRQRKRKHL